MYIPFDPAIHFSKLKKKKNDVFIDMFIIALFLTMK